MPDIPFLAKYDETNISPFFQDHLTTDCRKWQAVFYKNLRKNQGIPDPGCPGLCRGRSAAVSPPRADAQLAADAAAGEAIDPVQHRGQRGDHRGAGGHAGELAGGEAVVVEVHDHEVKRGDDGGPHDGGHQEHLGHLPPQIGRAHV